MKFAYKGFDKLGKPASGTLDAPDVADARQQLRRQSVFVTSVGPVGAGGPGGSAAGGTGAGAGRGRVPFFGRGRRMRDTAALFRQMSVLVGTGTPVVDALLVQERQLPAGAWRTVVEDVRKRTEEGCQLSEALAHHPAYFDPICRSLVAAGETRGKLGEMLLRLADLLRQQVKARSAVLGAMVYPGVLMGVAAGVLTMMMGFVLPRFELLFTNLGAPLPPTTQVLMDASAWLRSWWWGVFVGVVAAGAGCVWGLRTPRGERARDEFLVKAPLVGRLVRAVTVARIARVLGVLMGGHVTLLDALALTRQAAGNSVYADLISKAEDAVTRGEPVSSAFSDSALVSPNVCEALKSGERTGQVGPVLLTVADFMDEDNEVVVKSLTSILEPVILVVLGAVIGFVALSMFMPLFDLAGGPPGPSGGGGGGGAGQGGAP